MGGMEWKDTSSGTLSRGDVLVAAPEMGDPHFAQALVCLHDHGEAGSLGFVLNRPMGRTIGQVVPSADFAEPLRSLELYFGGPVQNDQLLLGLFRVHPPTHRFYSEMNVEEGELEAAMADPHCVVRAFLGYAGWGEGQLAAEVAHGDWRWTAPDEAMIRGESPRMWALLAEGDFRWRAVRDHFPAHPEWN